MSSINQEQIDYWNGEAGRVWAEVQARLDTLLAPISSALLERAAVQPGERVVDVGCGCGDTTLALARAGAAVWGIDLSEPMLARARERAAADPALSGRVAFSATDAASQAFSADHQLVFSRFGVMFFADPVAAFVNLRGALSTGGRLCFACWQVPKRNPWMAVAGAAVQPFLAEPASPPDPRAPGPFAFADPDYLRAVLTDAGFRDAAVDAVATTLHIGDTLEEAMQLMQLVGPLSRALRELEPPGRDEALDAARQALSAHVADAGLNLGAACWLVQAHPG